MDDLMTVRARISADIGELVELAAVVRSADGYPLYLPDENLGRFLSDPIPVSAWVALDGGRIVGHVAVNAGSHSSVTAAIRHAGIIGEVGVIARLLVDPTRRREGIGSRLLEHASAHVESLGWVPVLDVVATAEPAVSLYRRHGWTEIGSATFDGPDQSIRELVFAALTREKG